MAMEDWVLPLLKSLCKSGDWCWYGGPYAVMSSRKIGSQGEYAVFLLVYDKEDENLYFLWDPQWKFSPNVRALYKKAIDSVNSYIAEFKNGFGQFGFDKSGYILFSVDFDSTSEGLHLTTVEDINMFADYICNLCNNMYLAIRKVESGGNIDQFLQLLQLENMPVISGHA